MASVIYALDQSLTRLNSMAYRGLTVSATFFGGLPQSSSYVSLGARESR